LTQGATQVLPASVGKGQAGSFLVWQMGPLCVQLGAGQVAWPDAVGQWIPADVQPGWPDKVWQFGPL